jgi:iron complex transport system substrate-binding protein
MDKSRLIKTIPMILILGFLTACAPQTNSTPLASTYTDGLGREVSIENTPKRIVSLSASNTEILFAIGAGDQVVGRDEFSDYPAEVVSIPSVGGSMGKYSLEQIATLEPDLILAAEINTPEQVKAFEELDLTVYYLSNPKDIDGLYANLLLIGQITGNDKEAQTLVDGLKNRVDQVLNLEKPSSPIRVFYELDGSDPSKPWTPGKGTYMDLLLTLAGGENIGSTAGEGWLQISQEAILSADPQVILLGDAAYGITPEMVAERSGWSGISAVTDSRVYPFDDNLVSRPGPRLVDGLELIAEIIRK